MILKGHDAKDAAISALEKLLFTSDKAQQAAIAFELRKVRTGIKSESEAAALINMHLRNNKNTVVIHDLRLGLDDGRVAQIDHLLIHNSYRFYILESKHFSQGVKINDRGEFLRWNDWRKTYEYITSPIEQNTRRAAVLRQTLTSLGLPESHIQSFVLIAPHAPIERPKRFDSELVVKGDQFIEALTGYLENAASLGLLTDTIKTARSDSATDIAQKLIALHRPVTINYADKIWLGEISHLDKNKAQLNPIMPVATRTSLYF